MNISKLWLEGWGSWGEKQRKIVWIILVCDLSPTREISEERKKNDDENSSSGGKVNASGTANKFTALLTYHLSRLSDIVQTFQSPFFSLFCVSYLVSSNYEFIAKLSPLSIFVGIADAVKVNFKGFRNVASSTDAKNRKGSGSDCLFISSKNAGRKGEERRKSVLRRTPI